MNELSRNEVELEGRISSAPIFSHENHGIRFYRMELQIPRLSGQADILPILLSDVSLPMAVPGTDVRVRGQLRSFNNRTGLGSRLVLTVLARTVEEGEGETMNRILLSGVLCKPPILRRTPLGRSICDLMLAVSRHYGRADYLPAIAWGQLAIMVSRRNVGERVCLEGRVQSRVYTKVTERGPEERTAYEVSVMHLCEEGNEEQASV